MAVALKGKTNLSVRPVFPNFLTVQNPTVGSLGSYYEKLVFSYKECTDFIGYTGRILFSLHQVAILIL